MYDIDLSARREGTSSSLFPRSNKRFLNTVLNSSAVMEIDSKKIIKNILPN